MCLCAFTTEKKNSGENHSEPSRMPVLKPKSLGCCGFLGEILHSAAEAKHVSHVSGCYLDPSRNIRKRAGVATFPRLRSINPAAPTITMPCHCSLRCFVKVKVHRLPGDGNLSNAFAGIPRRCNESMDFPCKHSRRPATSRFVALLRGLCLQASS